jgi:hypothetical protein
MHASKHMTAMLARCEHVMTVYKSGAHMQVSRVHMYRLQRASSAQTVQQVLIQDVLECMHGKQQVAVPEIEKCKQGQQCTSRSAARTQRG